jgi:hypothetical protein
MRATRQLCDEQRRRRLRRGTHSSSAPPGGSTAPPAWTRPPVRSASPWLRGACAGGRGRGVRAFARVGVGGTAHRAAAPLLSAVCQRARHCDVLQEAACAGRRCARCANQGGGVLAPLRNCRSSHPFPVCTRWRGAERQGRCERGGAAHCGGGAIGAAASSGRPSCRRPRHALWISAASPSLATHTTRAARRRASHTHAHRIVRSRLRAGRAASTAHYPHPNLRAPPRQVPGSSSN